MAKLRIRLLGVFAHYGRANEIEVEVERPLRVRELVSEISAQFPLLDSLLGDPSKPEAAEGFMLIVNREIATLDTVVDPDDSATLVSPFVGG